ncbi:hypothetical protein FBU30_009239 [Linnemannia zychae]|nr:hypothetical protein FBU30_009239 [Linnemannia zychae]
MSATTTRLLFLTLPLLMLLLAAVSAAGDPAVLKLGNADNGVTSSATVDQAIQIKLKTEVEESFQITYGDPVSTDSKVVAPDGESKGNFKAATAGSAEILAEANCEDIQCPDPVIPWRVTLSVASFLK